MNNKLPLQVNPEGGYSNSALSEQKTKILGLKELTMDT